MLKGLPVVASRGQGLAIVFVPHCSGVGGGMRDK